MGRYAFALSGAPGSAADGRSARTRGYASFALTFCLGEREGAFHDGLNFWMNASSSTHADRETRTHQGLLSFHFGARNGIPFVFADTLAKAARMCDAR